MTKNTCVTIGQKKTKSVKSGYVIKAIITQKKTIEKTVSIFVTSMQSQEMLWKTTIVF